MQFFSQGKEDLASLALAAAMRATKMCQQHMSPFDSQEHQTWCEQILREHVATTVGDPESRGSYLKKHTTFLVTLEPQQCHTRRRFSDFEWLHSVLRARYVGMLIPSLPEKTVTLKSDAAFIQSRIRALNLFLDCVMQSPYLRSDASVSSFFSAADEKEWEAAKKETAVMENAGAGHLRWLMRITAEPASSTCEDQLAAFKKQLEELERTLVDISGCTKRMAEKSAALSKDVSALHTLFNGWKASEVVTSTSSATAASDPQDAAFNDLLDKSTTAVLGWSQVIRFEPAIYELLLHESVKYLLHQVKDLKELLTVREQALQTATAQQKAPTSSTGDASGPASATRPAAPTSQSSTASSTFSAAASTASMFASRFMHAAEPTAQETESQQKRARVLCDLITGALLSEEIDRFRKSKFTTVSDLMSQLACAEAQLTKRSASMWRDFMKTSTSDPKALVQSTKQILDNAVAHADYTSADAF